MLAFDERIVGILDCRLKLLLGSVRKVSHILKMEVAPQIG